MKGNVDTELVLYSAAIEYDNYDKAIVITSDGDFACLFKFLTERGRWGRGWSGTSRIIAPRLRQSFKSLSTSCALSASQF